MAPPALVKWDRVFHRKNRKGGVVRILREHYVRDDIACGSALCRLCTATTGNNAGEIPSDVRMLTIPDPKALCDYVELFETPEWRGLVILQTGTEKLLDIGHTRDYDKVRNILSDRRRGCHFFPNEHFTPTYVGPVSAALSPDERDKNATLAAAAWYDDHLRASGVRAVVLSDVIARDDAAALGVECLSMSEFLSTHFPTRGDLAELHESIRVAAEEAQKRRDAGASDTADLAAVAAGKMPSAYPAHASDDALVAGVQSGVYAMGVLHVTRGRASQLAFVRRRGVGYNAAETVPDAPVEAPTPTPREVLVAGMAARNRAVHGDLVAVELLPRAQWQSAASAVATASSGDDDNTVADDDVAARRGGVMPTGRVVGVMRRNWRDYVCTLSDDDGARAGGAVGNTVRVMAIPMDPRVPKIRVATRHPERLAGVRFVARIDRWDASQAYPEGHGVRVLGPIGHVDAETACILVENGLPPFPAYSSRQMAELPAADDALPRDEEGDVPRTDFRGGEHLVFSIDPLGSRDVDDALSVRRLPGGRVELAVHIADVSHFVRVGSANDFEARDRSTTLYLADRRYDMLPPLLSEDLCSLLGGKDRLAFSVVCVLREGGPPDGRTYVIEDAARDVRFVKSVIRSAYQMHYALAQDIFDRARPDDVLLGELRALKGGAESARDISAVSAVRTAVELFVHIARHFRRERMSRGALELESSEVRFRLSSSAANANEPVVEALIPKGEMEIFKTVAECMILANHLVARRIHAAFSDRALLRHHPPPQPEDFAQLVEMARERGYSVDTRSNKALAQSLQAIEDASGDAEIGRLFRTMATTAMSEAVYICTGDVESTDHLYHYGLALDFYTHFTSPIRRYADVVVHRQLAAALKIKSGAHVPPPGELVRMAQHINIRHRAAKQAQADSTELFTCIYFRQQLSAANGSAATSADAVIWDLRQDGFIAVAYDCGVTARAVLGRGGLLDVSPSMFLGPGEALLEKEGTSSVRGVVVRDGDKLIVRVTHCDALPSVPREITLRPFDRVRVTVRLVASRTHRDRMVLALAGWPTHASAQSARKPVSRKDVVAAVREAEVDSSAAASPPSENAHATLGPYGQSRTETLYDVIEDLRILALSARDIEVNL